MGVSSIGMYWSLVSRNVINNKIFKNFMLFYLVIQLNVDYEIILFVWESLFHLSSSAVLTEICLLTLFLLKKLFTNSF